MSATHSISLGPLSLLATQAGPLLTITIHAPSDTAPVGRMMLTVAEWTALVALVDCMGAAEKRHAEDRAEIERLSASVDRYQDAAWAGIEESSDNVECCAVGCSIVCASMNARASGWTINRNGLPFCSEHADRAFNPTETKSDRDSLRQQVRELTEERDKARRDVAANRALSMLAPKEMSYDDRSEFERLKHADIAQGKRIAELIAERNGLHDALTATQKTCVLRDEQLAAARAALKKAIGIAEQLVRHHGDYFNCRYRLSELSMVAAMTEIRFDKTIAERLCAEAEEDDAGFSGRFSYDVERGDLTYFTPDGDQDCSVCVGFMEHGEDTGKPVARMLNRHRDLAAQLRAAMAEVERLRGINAESGEWIDSAANIGVALREQLSAALAAKDELADLAKSVAWKLHRECPNDLDESEHPNTIKLINSLRSIGKDGGNE